MPDVLLPCAPLSSQDNLSSVAMSLTEAHSSSTRGVWAAVRTGPRPAVAGPSLTSSAVRLPALGMCSAILKPCANSRSTGRVDRALGRDWSGRPGRCPGGLHRAVRAGTGTAGRRDRDPARPFRRSVNLMERPVDVRMESWLEADTIRRMGFGHVIAARRDTLIVERGVSFAAFDAAPAGRRLFALTGRSLRAAAASATRRQWGGAIVDP